MSWRTISFLNSTQSPHPPKIVTIFLQRHWILKDICFQVEGVVKFILLLLCTRMKSLRKSPLLVLLIRRVIEKERISLDRGMRKYLSLAIWWSITRDSRFSSQCIQHNIENYLCLNQSNLGKYLGLQGNQAEENKENLIPSQYYPTCKCHKNSGSAPFNLFGYYPNNCKYSHNNTVISLVNLKLFSTLNITL